ncbi:MAG TPA: triose-phosphate isomerase [Flavobacteriales bacterium]|nr:triose-phosphate isomerase [Flavobacteriales bacterium]
MRKIVAGNWKMNKDCESAMALVDALVSSSSSFAEEVEVVIAPPFPFLAMAVERTKGTSIIVAAQNCHHAASGAYTGEVSAGMLKSIGVQACIVGHSERRQYFGESDAVIAEKLAALLAHDITPIFCCGEVKDERVAGDHFNVVTEQMKGALGKLSNEQLMKVVVAYEPVWAIGTGLTASNEQAQEMHGHIRALLHTHGSAVASTVPILYGGSCKPDNAEGLFAQPDVNGGLIGGASLDAAQFVELIRIAGLDRK